MEAYKVKIENIYKKLGLLVSRYNDLNSNFEKLQNENSRLKAEIGELGNTNNNLKEELKIVQLAKLVDGEDVGQKDELRKKLNQYIKEIDRCVAMLND